MLVRVVVVWSASVGFGFDIEAFGLLPRVFLFLSPVDGVATRERDGRSLLPPLTTASQTPAVNVPGPTKLMKRSRTLPLFLVHRAKQAGISAEKPPTYKPHMQSPTPPLLPSPGQTRPYDDAGATSPVQSLPLPGSATCVSHSDVSTLD